MSNPKTIVVLGADRVGKSTIVSKTLEQYRSEGIDAVSLHFSGPQPHHNSPIEQYIQPFNLALDSSPEVVICDRFGAEVSFYDKFRRNINTSEEWARSAESYFASKSSKISVFMIKRSWEWAYPHHVKELNLIYPEATLYFISSRLEARKAEHHAYYEYMGNYVKNRSLLNCTILDLGDNDSPDLCECVMFET